MKNLVLLFAAIAFAIVGIMFDGWAFSVVYKLGVVPVGEVFGLEMPVIGIGVFCLISCVFAYFNSFSGKKKESAEKYNLDDGTTYYKIFEKFIEKLVMLGLIWIINRIFIG